MKEAKSRKHIQGKKNYVEKIDRASAVKPVKELEHRAASIQQGCQKGLRQNCVFVAKGSHAVSLLL
jgi:hypothetical protein